MDHRGAGMIRSSAARLPARSDRPRRSRRHARTPGSRGGRRDAQFLSGNEFEHLLSPLCCGSRIDVVGDARIGESKLHSWKVDDVAPDEKPVTVGFNEPRRMARNVTRCGESTDARSDFVRLNRTDTIAIGGERRASEAEIALAFRGRARHRPVVFPKGELVLMQDELRLGEYSLSRRVDKPAT